MLTPRKFAGWCFGFVCVYEAVLAWHYISGDPQRYTLQFRDKYILHHGLVTAHAAGSVLALALGPLQFSASARRWWPAWHRWLGRLYLAGVALGATTGLDLGLMAEGGPVAQAGFVAMALAWLGTGWQAYRSIRTRRVAQHRVWMERNFALTFGAVMLRVYLHACLKLGIPFAECYPWTAWLGWLPNLVVIEGARRSTAREQLG